MRASTYLYGPLTRFGLIVAAVACVLDQASKLYLLHVYRPRSAQSGSRSRRFSISCSPAILASATACSRRKGALGQWLLLGFKAAAVALLWAGLPAPRPG